jgi:hypothetical protein
MVTNATRNLVFSVVDAQQEYQTKMILFFVLIVMFALMFWYSFKLLPKISNISDYELTTILTAIFMRIIPVIFIPLFPLWLVVFSYRGVALEQIMMYLFFAYGVGFTLMGIFGFIFGFEKLLQFFGLPKLTGKRVFRRRNFRRR